MIFSGTARENFGKGVRTGCVKISVGRRHVSILVTFCLRQKFHANSMHVFNAFSGTVLVSVFLASTRLLGGPAYRVGLSGSLSGGSGSLFNTKCAC